MENHTPMSSWFRVSKNIRQCPRGFGYGKTFQCPWGLEYGKTYPNACGVLGDRKTNPNDRGVWGMKKQTPMS
ncbi:hypothetical protein K0M31_008902 [Melipona bicolor]|uniref:Uncharacterized protein n=1 Tax=Melipona bicolor TaxID=60889 RepID=A0AA40FQK5_9HYME|nr:hypothetical protein K0M31_008902 [Melipona bicolor]